MKLANKSLLYLSVSLFVIIGLWSVVFYFNIQYEIKESVDEGLENYKRQIIYRAEKDPSILDKTNFEEGFFAFKPLSAKEALHFKDRYLDTFMYMQDADDTELELEPVRMLTTAFESNGRFYQLKIINSMVEEDDLVGELLEEALALYFILMASIILINNVVLQRVWKPFYSFLHQLKKYRIGHTEEFPTVNTHTKEFVALQKAVHTLLEQNNKTYEQQKKFIGNASHELQTPLAIMTNKLELLLENSSLQPNQAESIAEIMQLVDRLVRLNKSLLLLSKIENKQFLNNQTVSVNEIVRQNLSDLEELAEYKNITISVIENTELTFFMDHAMANIIIGNLIRNALFHNVTNGNISITLYENQLEIRNSGKPEALLSEKIFSRFYKSEPNSAGIGLGLAIIKAICELYAISIEYHFEKQQHLFRLRFK
ncbi:sensor histidine kinase [Flavobacterium agrisoli]|uniref:histidine kinase n=1 Tax=Flavobacterium agrisoli TaxID=2793066 RepID=A0A934UKM1_9FLAO|nr:HAMP domain-containing sensor histidine kinase [Flavobacterium agrisoli]MBK0371117.1 HAMP domain-containing histidine kinase [Flavobacterium agrisoli]